MGGEKARFLILVFVEEQEEEEEEADKICTCIGMAPTLWNGLYCRYRTACLHLHFAGIRLNALFVETLPGISIASIRRN